jgi:catechol 2,3-dioxygenase-like lactoylglutathione lyase family enzyme
MEHIIARLLKDFESGHMTRRQLIQSLALAGVASAAVVRGEPAFAAEGGLKATGVDHISYRVSDYKRTRDFYADLLGMSVTDDTGTQCELRFGDKAMITARNPRQPTQAVPNVDHVSYWIADWDTDRVKAQFDRRSLMSRLDLGDKSSPENYVSFHIKDPDGTDVQIAGVAEPGDSQYRKA